MLSFDKINFYLWFKNLNATYLKDKYKLFIK